LGARDVGSGIEPAATVEDGGLTSPVAVSRNQPAIRALELNPSLLRILGRSPLFGGAFPSASGWGRVSISPTTREHEGYSSLGCRPCLRKKRAAHESFFAVASIAGTGSD
jgi:hypothetical protein